MELDVGRRNLLWGAIGLFVFNALAWYLEVRLSNPEWRAGTNPHFSEMRYYLNSAHSHGGFFSLLNIAFALLIDKTVLPRWVKQLGSWLGLVGFVAPIVLFIGAFYKPVAPTTVLGCTAMNMSLLILAVGVVRQLRKR